jgi:hypothetical protein
MTRQCAASSKPNQKGSGDAGGAWKRGRVKEDDDEAEEEDDDGNEQGANDEMGEIATLWLHEASAVVKIATDATDSAATDERVVEDETVGDDAQGARTEAIVLEQRPTSEKARMGVN